MALSKFDKDMQIIQALDDEPNDVGGLTSAELKAKFDEGGEAVKQYINETLTAEVASREELQDLILGQIPDGTITRVKMDEDFFSTIADVSKMFYPNNQYGGIVVSDALNLFLNDLSVNGFYTCYSTNTGTTNAPFSNSNAHIIHLNSNVGTVTAYQIAVAYNDGRVLSRAKRNSVWTPWSIPFVTGKHLNNDWVPLQSYTVPGSFTWIAPDLFNGQPYQVGVFMVGGGASGEALALPNTIQSASKDRLLGGASGFCDSFIATVTPGTVYNLVIGAGGAAYFAPRPTYAQMPQQNAGGSTSGFSHTVLGGPLNSIIKGLTQHGMLSGKYQAPEFGSADLATWYMDPNIPLEGGIPTASIIGTTVTYFFPTLCSPCFDPFSGKFRCSAGQGVLVSYTQAGVITAAPPSAKGSEGGAANVGGDVSVNAWPGINGSGGGAAMSLKGTATSGKGGDGFITIYVKGNLT